MAELRFFYCIVGSECECLFIVFFELDLFYFTVEVADALAGLEPIGLDSNDGLSSVFTV